MLLEHGPTVEDIAQVECDSTTSGGQPVWFYYPERTPLVRPVIKNQLQNICRYNGGVPCRLIQHLALCTELAEYHYPGQPIIRGYCSWHDAHETVVADVVAGMKQHVPQFREIELLWEIYYHDTVGLPWGLHPGKPVKHIDLRALATEMYSLGHGGAPRTDKYAGGPPTRDESEIFQTVWGWSLDRCWDVVWGSVQDTAAHISTLP